MNINPNYLKLQDGYLFSRINQKINEYLASHQGADIIRLGIGDVTLPLAPAVVDAMQRALAEMGCAETFRGYADEYGYLFLRQAICQYYTAKHVQLHADEIFISDGAKSDLGNILDIFESGSTVLIPNPVYPVYVDTNIMAGNNIIYMNGNAENNFLPMPDAKVKADIIYLCSPNNPTGAVYNHEQLAAWVAYATQNDAVILFDSAYEIFVQDKDLPTSIYQIEGAKKCAIEFCSFSKTAGFTGTRCGYTIVPHELIRQGTPLNKLWLRRQTTKFNGVSYVVQRGAEAVFSEKGMMQIKENIHYYLQNAEIISKTLTNLHVWHTGGKNAPYIWLKCPNGMSSWDFFDDLLDKANVVGTPGAGFGLDGFFRLSAFGARKNVIAAMSRFDHIFA